MTCMCSFYPRKGPVERVAFPAANPTVSPYQQLGQYIMILGQKIDLARKLEGTGLRILLCSWNHMCPFLDRLRSSVKAKLEPHCGNSEKAKEFLGMTHLCIATDVCGICHPRLSDGIATPLERLQTLYKDMVQKQGDAMVTAPDRQLLMSLFGRGAPVSHVRHQSSIVFACRALQSELTKKFVDCTKEDTMMSVWIVRARRILCRNVRLGVAKLALPMKTFQTRRMLAGSGAHQKQKNRKWRRRSGRKNQKNARRRRQQKLMQTTSKMKVKRLFLKRIDLMT